MKWFAGYWIVGCLLLGIGLGARIEKCPDDKIPVDWDTIIFVATWPSVFGAIWFDLGTSECDATPPHGELERR